MGYSCDGALSEKIRRRSLGRNNALVIGHSIEQLRLVIRGRVKRKDRR